MKSASQDLQAFYRAAQKQEDPKRMDRRAVRSALLSAGAFSVAANAGATSGALAAIVPGAAKIVGVTQFVGYIALGAALGGGAAVVAVTATSTPAVSATTSPVTISSTRAVSRNEPTRASVREPASEPGPASESEPANELAPQPNARRVVAPTQPSAPSAPSLTEETRGLAEVQAALGAHDAHKALQLLAAQDRAFAAGALGQERSAARVFALCAAGQYSKAETAKAAFLRKYPEAPLAKRVSAACEK